MYMYSPHGWPICEAETAVRTTLGVRCHLVITSAPAHPVATYVTVASPVCVLTEATLAP